MRGHVNTNVIKNLGTWNTARTYPHVLSDLTRDARALGTNVTSRRNLEEPEYVRLAQASVSGKSASFLDSHFYGSGEYTPRIWIRYELYVEASSHVELGAVGAIGVPIPPRYTSVTVLAWTATTTSPMSTVKKRKISCLSGVELEISFSRPRKLQKKPSLSEPTPTDTG